MILRMTQEAPFPTALADLVKRVEYRPGELDDPPLAFRRRILDGVAETGETP